jgi:hypothetical protein
MHDYTLNSNAVTMLLASISRYSVIKVIIFIFKIYYLNELHMELIFHESVCLKYVLEYFGTPVYL